ncbi:outer membrane protein OmpA-like peptidoglycan-associated protein [Saonia flava]|uniref:Outer membrane protein OmpA-like peptidoglycan-associated protein n=1 Tax=Saonia flava TaxID=523696 RepID=A0A846R4F3_9FLAO|nr:OmpA family protein [Saonia flava]NJB72855.1 outer membrane protein OmpA-like peptidoglycan-associated protein [Saonia flava]
MKTLKQPFKLFLGFFFMISFCGSVNAQFLKKLGKKAQKAAERTIERRVEEESSKTTDKALDSILEPGSKGEQGQQVPNPTSGGSNEPSSTSSPGNENNESSSPNTSKEPKSLTVYSKFDFVPGDKPMFFDDFGNDFIGDFPSKWNTNAGGEVVTLGDSSQKWFEMKSGYNIFFIPNVPQLPEEYTIEFDVETVGLSKKTSSTAHLRVDLSDDDKFKEGANFVQAHIPFCQYSPIGITVENKKNNKREIYSTIKADIRDEILNKPHISIAVNKERYRVWVNEVKYADVPKMVPSGSILHTLKFHMNNFKDGEERIFISNLKVAEGGVDLRRKLIAEGKISTNGILFNSGSANLKPESMGIIRQIYQVLQQDSGINLKIVGHTDSDGDDGTNMSLSKSRAEAVKKALVEVYGVSDSRLQAEGKGESEPVADNGTSGGKAQNRRVEFIKI